MLATYLYCVIVCDLPLEMQWTWNEQDLAQWETVLWVADDVHQEEDFPRVKSTGVQMLFDAMCLCVEAFVYDVVHNKQLTCTERPRLRHIRQIIITKVQRCKSTAVI